MRVKGSTADIYRLIRFVFRILWSERKRRTVGCVTRVLNPSGKNGYR